MFSIFYDITLYFLKILFIFSIPFIFIFLQIFILFFYNIIYKKKKLPKKGIYKENNIFKKLFIEFPKQFIQDIFNKKDYEFNEYGIHMICGEQGSGKTITLIYILNKWRKKYPKCKIATNLNYKYENDVLENYKNVINRSNGFYGQIEVIDEIQTWFNSNHSKNFPVEMLGEISQQRKQRKCIIGTSQIFSRIAKPIREQTHYIYLPFTIFGCITIVRKSHIKYWDNENQKFKRYLGFFFFVHNSELRNSYDTYKRISSYQKNGFKNESDYMQI